MTRKRVPTCVIILSKVRVEEEEEKKMKCARQDNGILGGLGSLLKHWSIIQAARVRHPLGANIYEYK